MFTEKKSSVFWLHLFSTANHHLFIYLSINRLVENWNMSNKRKMLKAQNIAVTKERNIWEIHFWFKKKFILLLYQTNRFSSAAFY